MTAPFPKLHTHFTIFEFTLQSRLKMSKRKNQLIYHPFQDIVIFKLLKIIKFLLLLILSC